MELIKLLLEPDNIVKFVIPLFAAFFGSFATYSFGVYKEKKVKKNEKIQAGQAALFALVRQL